MYGSIKLICTHQDRQQPWLPEHFKSYQGPTGGSSTIVKILNQLKLLRKLVTSIYSLFHLKNCKISRIRLKAVIVKQLNYSKAAKKLFKLTLYLLSIIIKLEEWQKGDLKNLSLLQNSVLLQLCVSYFVFLVCLCTMLRYVFKLYVFQVTSIKLSTHNICKRSLISSVWSINNSFEVLKVDGQYIGYVIYAI